ncbi:hypothetical protein ATCV1_z419L [Acanthocystis turfacea chlorella virus 1]|uniref:Uncharacterized protein z419L n=1 Tax=Chlorovirus heliozoae TaxID=322019 RepID=A7K929_9PHYC|nr:hypothetical protein ATCV1_z419L [Acanthocystis turfacea chlorella virus 1]ABT16553.1 hypothetical protein ATCV1_z419L [Acanthocystis turfacea chlorella virus 1]
MGGLRSQKHPKMCGVGIMLLPMDGIYATFPSILLLASTPKLSRPISVNSTAGEAALLSLLGQKTFGGKNALLQPG